MKVLIVGGGGREHAIASAVIKSKRLEKLYCAPGNAGIAEIAECVPIDVMDFDKLIDFAKEKQVDFVIVGPDDPLANGIVDKFNDAGIKAFGPNKAAAKIEASKAFAKSLMKKYDIPTAEYEVFTDYKAATEFLESMTDGEFPVVLKADGLALGKGVLICGSLAEAVRGVKEIMVDRNFGDAGNTIVIEKFMTGREVSVLAFADGKVVKPMTSAQDHKRIGDKDTGLNTGGMGTFSPSPFYTSEVDAFCKKHIYEPTIEAMEKEGAPFTGVLFFGLMLTNHGPKVLEYNARFGDPETQVVLPRLKSDILDIMEACVEKRLDQIVIEFEDNAAVCVVAASGGYPQSYEKGKVISGLEYFDGKNEIFVFHAGTKKDGENIVTSGGRVIGVTAIGDTLGEARDKAYEAIRHVNFDGIYMRSDIGKELN